MNELFIINASAILKEDINSIKKAPKFRKATKSMLMSSLAIQRVIEPYEQTLKQLGNEIGLFLGTGHGELEATRDFLKRFKGTGYGSPIFFQNSLHNSTVGFLTQQLGINGVSLTTTNSYFSGESALDLAVLSLKQKQISFALVVGVDALVPGLEEALNRMYPEGLKLGEGAGAILLCNFKGLDLLKKTRPWCCFEGIEYSHQSTPLSKESLAEFNGYYDSNFISLFAQQWSKGKGALRLVFYKPDGTHSKVNLKIDSENIY